MQTFKIEIQELLSKIIEIDALNLDDAISQAKEKYRKEEIVLSETDYISTEFAEYLEK